MDEFIKRGKQATEELEKFGKVMSEGEKLGNEFFGGIAAHLGIGQSKIGQFTVRFQELMEKGEEGIEDFNKQFNKHFSAMNIGMSIMTKLIETTISFATAVDKATASFAANTGAGRVMTADIDTVGSSFRNLGITAEQAGKSAESLFTSFPGFLNLSSDTRQEMMLVVAGLDKLGVAMEDSGATVMFFAENLGMTGGQAANMTRELAMTGKALGMTSSKIVKDFNQSLKTLAVYGDKAPKVFKGLAAQAQAAGVQLESLLGLADKFDTFASAAETTGKLNAILGSQLSTTEMLMMTEDERIETLISTIQAQGVAFKDMDRFTQKAIGAAAGIEDMNEAQRIFGMSLGQYKQFSKDAENAAKKEEEFNKRMKEAMSIVEKLQMMMAEWAISLGPLIDDLAALIQWGVDFMAANSWIVKFGAITMGATLLLKALWPLKALLLVLGAKIFPTFTAAITGNVKMLSKVAPEAGVAGGGLLTLSAGVWAVVTPVTLLVGSIAALVYAFAKVHENMSAPITSLALMKDNFSELTEVLDALGDIGFFTGFGLGSAVEGLMEMQEVINKMKLKQLQATADIMKALTGKTEANITTGVTQTKELITFLKTDTKKIEPLLENLALISVGSSAQTMAKGGPTVDFASPINKMTNALEKITGMREVTLKIDKRAFEDLVKGKVVKLQAE